MPRTVFSCVSALALAVLATACGEHPSPTSPFTGQAAPLGPITPAALQVLDCRVLMSTRRMSCADGSPGGAVDRSLIVGGQNAYVFLSASTTSAPGDPVLATDVTVQNLIPQALGTTDGTTPDASGVDVFFSVEPVGTGGSVTLANPDGHGTFLGTNQAYYEYSGSSLGVDGILSPNETTGARNWQFNVDPGVTSFTFKVYVSANVKYPMGYIDLAPSSSVSATAGSTSNVTSVVRSAVGVPLADQTVSWASSAPAAATVDNSGLVTAVAQGHTTLTATSGPRSASLPFFVCPSMNVGDVVTIDDAEGAGFCLSGGASGDAEYTLTPVNQSAGSNLSLTVLGTGIQAVTGPPTPDRLAPAGLTLARLPDVNELATREKFEMEMRDRDARTLPSLAEGRAAWAREHAPGAVDPRNDPLFAGMRTYVGTRPLAHRARSSLQPGGPSQLITPNVVPSVGDSMDLNTTTSCSGTASIRRGVVRSVRNHLIIVADTANPAGGFTTAQYDSIGLEFDTLAWPVDSSAFGAPTDLDNNSHVVAFFTRAVNELSPPASSSVTLGFFASKDIFSSDPSSCPNSNEGEMFYMLVPDPTGAVNSNVRTVSFVRGNTTGTMGHEFQHMINATRRLYINGGSTFEDGYLNEGLSHIAEELMFYRASFGLAPRQNIVLSNLTTGPNASRRVAAFNSYANQNYGRFRSWLQRPDTAGAFKQNANSLAVRGAIWSFLRYASDRVNGDDNAFWYSMVNSNLTGLPNIQNAIGGADPQQWERDWTMAMYGDDAVSGVATKYTNPSWSYRSLYIALNGSYQLVPRSLSNATPLSLSYSPGGGTAYTRFGVAQGGYAMLSVLAGGSTLPTSPVAIVVMRTR